MFDIKVLHKISHFNQSPKGISPSSDIKINAYLKAARVLLALSCNFKAFLSFDIFAWFLKMLVGIGRNTISIYSCNFFPTTSYLYMYELNAIHSQLDTNWTALHIVELFPRPLCLSEAAMCSMNKHIYISFRQFRSQNFVAGGWWLRFL